MNSEKDRVLNQMKIILSKKKLQFSQVLDQFPQAAYRDILLAWGELRETGFLQRTSEGLYFITQSKAKL